MTEAAIAVIGVWTFLIGMHALTRRPNAGADPPPRPEWLREQFAKKPIKGPLATALLAMFLLPFLVPAVLLIALSESTTGRTLGAALGAWAVGTLAMGIWSARPARKKRFEERLLAHSEAFWSRPDAEEWAKRLRRVGPP